MKYSFKIQKTNNPKVKPNPEDLRFGKIFTDHMFIMEYSADKGWHDGRIMPYGPLALTPAAAVLHYAQMMFEGLKAYKTDDGRIQLFRPNKNAERVNKTNHRMDIPELPEDLFVESIKSLVSMERDWVPDKPGTSLYIRPFIIADEPFLGVHSAQHFLYIVICSPTGPYYAKAEGGLGTTTIFVEQEYIRAAQGGTGYAKVGGNYAGSLKAQKNAEAFGCDQVMWLDAVEHSYVEEIGSSNAFFVIGDEVVTPPTSGTILSGVTRDSVIELLKKWGVKVSERRIRIEDILKAAEDGSLKEIFASGTAAVISPVGKLVFKDKSINVGSSAGELAQKLYDELYGIQTGGIADYMNWTVEV